MKWGKVRASERSTDYDIRRRNASRRQVGCIGVAFLLGACQAFGPATVPGDAFDYSTAIARARSDQMLLNIVRMRYIQVPNFLTVSSVIAGYTYQGGVGVLGQKAFGPSFNEDFAGGSANLGYIERPTITYSPLQGEAFSRRLMRNIPIEVLFSLGQAGWPSDVLFRIAVDRLGNARNMAFSAVEVAESPEEQANNLEIYDRVVTLINKMEVSGELEVVQRLADDSEILRFAAEASPEGRNHAAEFKRLVGLDPDRQEFRVTDRTTGRQPGDVLIRTRSLLAMMNFLGLGIDIPEADSALERVIPAPDFVRDVFEKSGPMRIRSSLDRPEDPYVAIRYRNHWFYIQADDQLSKRTFNTMQVLFELLAPGDGGAAPLLSLPTG